MKSHISARLLQLLPFLWVGIAIALAIGVFLVLSYVFVWGLIIGGILWIFSLIKDYFSEKKQAPPSPTGRVIDHEKHQK